jgi:hypothetical protein
MLLYEEVLAEKLNEIIEDGILRELKLWHQEIFEELFEKELEETAKLLSSTQQKEQEQLVELFGGYGFQIVEVGP